MVELWNMNMDFAGIASKISNTVLIIFGIVLVVVFISGIILLYFINKQYKKFRVVVFKRFKNKRGDEIPFIIDFKEQAAIKKDRKLNKWIFHLRKRNLDMGQDEGANLDEQREIDIPSIPSTQGKEVVFIEELAKRKYAFAEPLSIDGNIKLQVSTADVAEAVRAYDMHVKTFTKKDNVIWAFAMYVVFAVLILILIAVVLNKLETLQQFGDKWIEGAKILTGSNTAVPTTVPG